MYNEIIFRPLYNGLVGIMNVLPWIDVGIAVIIFTIIVKLILFPLAKSALLTQVKMKEVESEVNKIKSQYSSDRQTQALKVMELYKQRGIKPFSSVILLIIQLPILLALISVFYKVVPTIHPEFLYSFISVPIIKTHFLGFIDLTQKSLLLSLLTGVLQFAQLHFSLSIQQNNQNKPTSNDLSSQISGTMGKQMKYMLPILAFASTYWIIPAKFPQAAAIIAIYWSISSLFTLVQEIYIRKKHIK